MKQKKIVRIIAIIIAVALAVSLLMLPMAGMAFAAEPEEDGITVLFTHDLHDRLLPANRTDAAGKTSSSGGYARLKTAMDEIRAQHKTTITVDAGDFSMGSLFQCIYESEAPELRMLGILGVDATTFGNHEFDYGPNGLAAMLDAARESGDPLPRIVQANYKTPVPGASDEINAGADIQRAMNDYGVADYTVFERGGITIAVFGIMGTDSDMCAPNSGMELDDPIETAKAVVETIQAEESPDLIICLSHSGTSDDEKNSEDESLAKAVPDIDLIVSGHTHTTLTEPLQVGDTYIVSSGAYCQNLGEITLVPAGDGIWAVENYALHSIDDSLAEDQSVTARIEDFKSMVQIEYLDDYGLTFDQVLAHNDVLFTPVEELETTTAEIGLGNLLADSYIYTLQQLEGADYETVALAAVPLGVVRASLPLGDLTTADAFDVLSLGVGADGTVGYPLVSVYVNGRELEDIAEIDASVSSMMSYARLYTAGITYTYNPNRLPLDYVTDLKLITEDGSTVWPNKEKLYRVVTDLYSAQMFSAVKAQAHSFLKITPKDAAGNEITDFTTAIIHDRNGNEIKAWQSAALYLQSFEQDANGVSVVPAYYSSGDGRKILNDEKGIGAILSNPGPITLLAIVIIVIALILLALITQVLVRRWNQEHEHDTIEDHL